MHCPKQRAGLAVPNLGLYYDAAQFVWLYLWLFPGENRVLYDLEQQFVDIPLNSILWCPKRKRGTSILQTLVPQQLLRTWDKYKNTLSPGISPWTSIIKHPNLQNNAQLEDFQNWEAKGISRLGNLIMQGRLLSRQEMSIKTSGWTPPCSSIFK